MIIFFPHRVEVLHPVWPITNFTLIGLCFLATGAWFGGVELLDHLVLDSWNPIELFLHTLLHADILHLIFNMLYLWVFGNAICAKFGNLKFLLVFFGGALAASATHLLLDGYPAVGASGAINAVIGVFLALYPVNRIHCLFIFFFRPFHFSIKAYWLIGFWFLTDVFGVFSGGESNIAFWAHIGGFVAGLAFGLWALQTKWVGMDEVDNETLLDILHGGKPKPDWPTQVITRIEKPSKQERRPELKHTGQPLQYDIKGREKQHVRRKRRKFPEESKESAQPAKAPDFKLKSFEQKTPKPDASAED